MKISFSNSRNLYNPWAQLIIIEAVCQVDSKLTHFHVFLEVLRQRIISHSSTQDITGNRTCAVAVATVVDGSYHSPLKVVEMARRTKESNGKRLVANPSLPQAVDAVNVGFNTISQLQRATHQAV